MTTIAVKVFETDRKRVAEICSDTRACIGNLKIGTYTKIHKCDNNSLIAFCGDLAMGDDMFDYIKYHNIVFNDRLDIKDFINDFYRDVRELPRFDVYDDIPITMLIVLPDATIWSVVDRGLIQINDVFAIGSGDEIAIGALANGAHPKEAVTIAAKYDVHTNNDVHSFRVEYDKLDERFISLTGDIE